MADVAQYGLDALAHIRANRVANADIVEGLLFGLNGSGKIVVADAATAVKAVGIVVNGSPNNWGDAIVFNKVSTLKSGQSADLNKYAIIDVAEGTYTNAQIGTKIYLGASGAYTLTRNTTVGQLDQHVGYVLSTGAVLIDLSNDTEGTTNAVENTDVVFYSANGAITPAGFALVTGGTGIAGLTLGAPSKGTYLEIRIDSLSSGNVVVTTGTGITLNVTGNNTATFNAANEALRLGYYSATRWQIIENVGAVALSTV